ncbi:MAG TPA: LysE/ArgO family amino acid transporter [Bauldia sp.]|nr:LysE/ArgO family amino acid transporter [Bauldia sp.]
MKTTCLADVDTGAAVVEGLLLGAGMIVAIGPQNAFVLRQGLQRSHVFALATTCAAADAILIAAGVAGLGTLVRDHAAWLTAVTVVGVAFLLGYGALSLRRAFKSETLMPSDARSVSLGAALGTVLALTFFNPHVYLDTIVVVGGLSARYPPPANAAFGIGAALASVVWFYGLGYGARLLAPLFARSMAWRILDVLVAIVMWGIAASLAVELWRSG